jgi:hypothetical protein
MRGDMGASVFELPVPGVSRCRGRSVLRVACPCDVFWGGVVRCDRGSSGCPAPVGGPVRPLCPGLRVLRVGCFRDRGSSGADIATFDVRRDKPARRRRWKSSTPKGLATRGGPESCVASREGRGEALAGVRAGRAIEPRNWQVRGAHAVSKAEGSTAGGVFASRQGTPRGRRTRACAEPSCARTGRSRAGRSAWSGGGPPGERCGGNPRTDGGGKSDWSVVPASLPNEARAEGAGEERD